MSKRTQSKPDDLVIVTIRTTRAVADRIDREAERRRRQNPGAVYTRSSILRSLIDLLPAETQQP